MPFLALRWPHRRRREEQHSRGSDRVGFCVPHSGHASGFGDTQAHLTGGATHKALGDPTVFITPGDALEDGSSLRRPAESPCAGVILGPSGDLLAQTGPRNQLLSRSLRREGNGAKQTSFAEAPPPAPPPAGSPGLPLVSVLPFARSLPSVPSGLSLPRRVRDLNTPGHACLTCPIAPPSGTDSSPGLGFIRDVPIVLILFFFRIRMSLSSFLISHLTVLTETLQMRVFHEESTGLGRRPAAIAPTWCRAAGSAHTRL